MSLFFNSLRPSIFPAAYLYTEHSQAFNVSGDKKMHCFLFFENSAVSFRTRISTENFQFDYLECFMTSPGCVELPQDRVLPG